MTERFYLTTPIYYVNSVPHLGHVYTTLIADTITRFKRQRGMDTYFLTGTDEHGDKIQQAAQEAGVAPKDHVDNIVAQFKKCFEEFGFEYNHFIRTTDDYHERGAQDLWRTVRDAGYIYKGQYEGWFCHFCQEFVTVEDNPDGTPPLCPNDWCQRPVERVAEESYFFKLSEFQDKLLEHYEKNPEFIRPEIRRNEVISFVKSGLRDLSVSRVSVKWGIPVPGDPKHTMYVWFDALSNYWTAVTKRGENENLSRFWPADLHLIGKDILRFHTVYWPAFLLAAGIPLPKSVFSHGFWLSGGRKMSKSLGNGIDINILLKHFRRDWVRYYCLREMVFGGDGDFTYQAFIDRVNSDLAKGLGNLSSRVLTMITNYCGCVIPAATNEGKSQADEIHNSLKSAKDKFEAEFEQYAFSRGLDAIWDFIAVVDKYLSDNAPWNLAKDETKRGLLETVLNTSVRALNEITVLLAPVMPDSTDAIWGQLGFDGSPASVNPSTIDSAKLAGHKIGSVSPVFPRLDKEKVMSEIKQETGDVPQEAKTEPPKAETSAAKPEGDGLIDITDFAKVDLRVGVVLEAERIPKSDKLLKMKIDLGEAQPRQILGGIAEYYTPEQMIGRKVVVVANLKPRKLRGFESQGMIVAASVGDEGSPVLAGFHEEVPIGARLK